VADFIQPGGIQPPKSVSSKDKPSVISGLCLAPRMPFYTQELIFMKTKLLVLILLGGTSLFARTRVSIGIGIGGFGYVAPPPVVYAPPPYYPAPAYGYYYPPAPRYYGYSGYWGRPVYGGAYRVGPRYYGNRYYNGRGRRY
jgi:hypothetical protein